MPIFALLAGETAVKKRLSCGLGVLNLTLATRDMACLRQEALSPAL